MHNILLITFLISAIAATGVARAQDPDAIPVNASGEQIFGPGYMPSEPSDNSVPLEPGRPAAGIQLPTAPSSFVASGVFSRASIRRGDATINAPLLRNVRREKKLRRFKRSALPGFSGPAVNPVPPAAAALKVHFVDVGQGAGAILEFPCHTALIDSGGEWAKGAGSVDGGKLFADYLDSFFDARPSRNRTIDLLITSHPHKDHLAGLQHISAATGADAYKVRNVVDNGQTHDKGDLASQKAFQTWAKAQTPPADYQGVSFKSATIATGVTNRIIDPIGLCQGVDPIITVLWGAYNEKIATGGEDWKNPNNHSLVVRVDYGDASMLFVGDLEDDGANEMLREYDDNPKVFDVHVYHVSHHGAGEDTFDTLLEKMSPSHAILSMGSPAARGIGSASGHGHPRLNAINVMQELPDVISQTRPTQTFTVASKPRVFKQVPISKAIYGTGWEGTIIMTANADGTITIP